MNINDLKSQAYDIIRGIEAAQVELRRTNELITEAERLVLDSSTVKTDNK